MGLCRTPTGSAIAGKLYIAGTQPSEVDRRPLHECPPDKRAMIKQAFLHFGMLEP
jgi:hypothetical protein